MSDNNNIKDGRDESRIDKNDPNEIEFVHSRFPSLTHREIKQAIEDAGPVRNVVYEHIKRKYLV